MDAITTQVDLPRAAVGVQWTTRAASVTDPNLSLEDWEATLRAAGEIKRAMSFVIGDLLLFGSARYGERYSQGMDATGLAYSTLSTYVYVCEHVPQSRRRQALGFGHHKAVAALEPADQKKWLDKAEEEGLTREQLRDRIRESSSRDENLKPPPKQEVLGAEQVDAAANLSRIRKTLKTVASADLSDAAREALGLPQALRAIDEISAAATAANSAPPFEAAARLVVANATSSGGFYMVEGPVFEAFARLVPRDAT